MNLTLGLWNILVPAIQANDEAPAWLKRQAGLSHADLMRLPTLEAAGESVDVIPGIEETWQHADYLDFLREQIKLEPRGPEWGKILKKRLAGLEPFAGKKLIRVSFYSRPDSTTLNIATLQLNPETSEVVHMEFH